MRISSASIADIPGLCGLLDELFRQEAEFTPDRAAQARGLAAILGDPEAGRILVARDGDRLLGMVNLLWLLSVSAGGPVALLEDMVVAPQARRAGVGSPLLGHAIGVCEERGCRRVTLLADAANHPAHRFYQRFGFRPAAGHPMRLVLPIHFP